MKSILSAPHGSLGTNYTHFKRHISDFVAARKLVLHMVYIIKNSNANVMQNLIHAIGYKNASIHI